MSPRPSELHPLRDPLVFRINAPEVFFALVALLIGAGNAFTIRLVGLMPVSEIVILAMEAYVAVCMLANHRVQAPLGHSGIFAGLVVCQVGARLGYVIADYYRDSAPGDAFRGWARMFFLAIDVAVMALLLGKSPHVFVAYLLGVSLSGANVLVQEQIFGDYWKFGYGYPLTGLALVVSPGVVLAAFGMAAANFVMDYRSMTATCSVVGSLVLLAQFSPRFRRVIVVLLAIASLVALPAAVEIFSTGENPRHERSNAERSAMLTAATEATAASPFLGHGSWFSRTRVMDNFAAIRAENAGVGGFDETKGEEMAIHSQILVSMAEGGVLGGTFFIVYGATLLWVLYYTTMVRRADRITAALLLMLINAVMALCFSPFSGAARVEIAAATAAVLMLAHERRQRAKAKTPEPDYVESDSLSFETPALAIRR